ncbi:acetolactate synthase small subunit [Listeria sp. FSL L7-1485]|uniref:Acetolactate synthase small subunit n=1 Tax=Listeria immobilis TaxID=2713502 RepID=A0A7X1C8Q9_9LIST|nr:acetolactate synthase small subunit [Listeria immobilis]MBC1482491.1 acetolactate synthase small subunit [Listeria immobilis]MBC1488524.1 acetolactate synthase small subunit [Listeria immobilis]MBC1506711.1 acetolactate synthase small subunit [Listeria immobilis]MBC1508960.1 acetolactate synthase small subunit [Listeria immobilis]MBC1515899.1 acetolactate synthase small subunit [Listeria immobilis]
MRRIITATVNNSSGVLNRITGVISRRQYNIDSISVGWTEIPNVSRITIVVHVDSLYEIEQVTKQLNKQIDVLKVSDITDDAHIERELALIKINSPAALRSELNAVIEPFRATVIDVGTKNVVIQVTGTSEKIDAFVDIIRPYGIKQMARTGVTGFTRSAKKMN